MHILGLPDFSLSNIQNYVEKRSAFLPVLGRIKLPKDLYPEHETIETKIKIAAAELAYLRLAEETIKQEVQKVLKQLTATPEDKELQDKRTALNLQKQFVLSLNEQITVETLKYCYFTILWPLGDPSDYKKMMEEASNKLHGNLLQWNKAAGTLERNANSRDFADFMELIKHFLVTHKYQSEKVELPTDINLYLSEYLREPLVDEKRQREKRKPN